MADPVTPNFQFTLPTVGSDRDTWGALLNENWAKADGVIQAAHDGVAGPVGDLATLIANLRAYIEPVGSIKPWPLPTAYCPVDWTPCDGGALSRAAFPELFAVLGTYYGVGDGSTTFNVPNYTGQVLIHRWGALEVGQAMGEAYHDLTQAEMPNHVHTGATTSDGNHNHSIQFSGGGAPGGGAIGQGGGVTVYADWNGQHYHTFSSDGAGGSQPHNNMQPSLAVLWIIKLKYQF